MLRGSMISWTCHNTLYYASDPRIHILYLVLDVNFAVYAIWHYIAGFIWSSNTSEKICNDTYISIR